MGMFDQLRLKQVMPDGYQSEDWYQTKSMECMMTDYEVDETGQLWNSIVMEMAIKKVDQFVIRVLCTFTKMIGNMMCFLI